MDVRAEDALRRLAVFWPLHTSRIFGTLPRYFLSRDWGSDVTIPVDCGSRLWSTSSLLRPTRFRWHTAAKTDIRFLFRPVTYDALLGILWRSLEAAGLGHTESLMGSGV